MAGQFDLTAYKFGAQKSLLAKAVNTVVLSLNYTGNSGKVCKTPYELWFDKLPKIDKFVEFVINAYSLIPKQLRKNLSQKGYFVGYLETSKSLHKDDPLEYSNKSEGDEGMDNKFESISEDNNEDQEHEQGDGSNVNVYNLRDRSNIKKPLRYDNSAFFIVKSDPVYFKEAVGSQNLP
ncbi:uncharacterized protein LOC113553319 [Rhopalosiphum maidis]|uniref:uncharacterized protein LOC113553319 n=1 Tax=Rhopalosiphum maidis TaxID=43146 RepID=UPI000EFDBB7B|nr:uncharacterized protein LOC113553319 [Rhopalosiphum maidis]